MSKEAGPAQDDDRWPRCGYCGSPEVHASRRGGGWQGSLLRLAGARPYRCEACHRRFAFAVLGRHARAAGRSGSGARRPHAHADSEVDEPLSVEDARRQQQLLRALLVVAAALLTFAVASLMIGRAERRALEGQGVVLPQ